MNPVCQTLDLLQQPGPPALLVSLPTNSRELALAALEAGAQGLKVHINLRHAAAGTGFGSLAEEAEAIAEIVSLGLPVGIVPGGDLAAVRREEVSQLATLGLDYLDVYVSAMPAWVPAVAGIGVMAAVGATDVVAPARLAALARLPGVQMVEASCVPHEGYGLPLSAGDLCDYTQVVAAMTHGNKPVIVPTQRAITPEDVPGLAATGIRALLIGAIVTGTEASSLARATGRYRQALSAL